jgi:hypothetical protein
MTRNWRFRKCWRDANSSRLPWQFRLHCNNYVWSKNTKLMSIEPENLTHSFNSKLMNIGRYSLLLALAFGLTACSSVKTQVNTGPLAAKTFSFVARGSKGYPNYAEKRDQIHAMIQEAITKNLGSKGVSKVNSGGDVTVAYLLILGNNVSTTSIDDYFGYGSDSSALVDKVHTEQTIKDKNRNYFESGTLIIDIVDTRNSKLLKRCNVQSTVLRDLAPDARQARIQSLVDTAMSGVVISK